MTELPADIYVRASKDRAGAGLSVSGQETDCRDLAARLSLTVRTVYADNDITASGKRVRPAYREMLAALAASPAHVLVWHVDRLYRHPVELEEYIELVEKRGILTHAVSVGELDLTTPSGRLVARLLGAVAKHELEHMSERRKAGKARAAAAGRWKGGRRPFGYEADGVTVRAAEAAAVEVASEDLIDGVSLAAIVRRWNTAGLTTSAGTAWKQRQVARVLARPRNAALMEHNGGVIGDAKWPAIVDRRIWEGVRAVLADPARRSSPGPAIRWLGSWLYECHCGQPVFVTSVGGKGRPMRPVYRCQTRRHVARDARLLDAYVGALVVARLSLPDAVEVWQARPAGDLAVLHAEQLVVQQRLDEAAGLYGDRILDARRYGIACKRLESELAILDERIAALARPRTLAAFAGRDPRAVWDSLGLDRKRAVVRLLMRVVLRPAPRGRPVGWRPGAPYFDTSPESIGIVWRREG